MTESALLCAVKDSALRRTLCQTHPDVDYTTAWGCPECVREMRAEIARLRTVFDRLRRALFACEHLTKRKMMDRMKQKFAEAMK